MIEFENEERNLKIAVTKCSERGLFRAAKWAAEQLYNLHLNKNLHEIDYEHKNIREISTKEKINEKDEKNSGKQEEEEEGDKGELVKYLLGKAEFDLRNHHTAIEILRNAKTKKCKFLYLYSKVLVVEKEEYENAVSTEEKNVEIQHIIDELNGFASVEMINRPHTNDDFDGFECYLQGLLLHKVSRNQEALDCLINSINLYEYNWSAWVMLEKVVEATRTSYQQIKDKLPSRTSIPKIGFLGLLESKGKIDIDESCIGEHQEGESNDEIDMDGSIDEQTQGVQNIEKEKEVEEYIDQMKNILPTSPFVISLQAKKMYNDYELEESKHEYEKMEYLGSGDNALVEEEADVYSNVLYLLNDRVGLSRLAEKCLRINRYNPKTYVVVGNYYSLIRDHEKAIVNFEKSIRLEPKNSGNTWILLGHEYLNVKNAPMAIKCYRRSLESECGGGTNDRYKGFMGLGNAFQNLRLYNYSIYYFVQAINAIPPQKKRDDHRAYLSLADCYTQIKHYSKAISLYNQILINVDINSTMGGNQYDDQVIVEEGIHGKLAKLYFEEGDIEKSVENYKLHLLGCGVDLNEYCSDEMSIDTKMGYSEQDHTAQILQQLDTNTCFGILVLAKYELSRINNPNVIGAKKLLNILVENGSFYSDEAVEILEANKLL